MKSTRFFKCAICGAVDVEFYHGKGSRVCCGEAMKELTPNTTEAAVEKHVPIIERNGIHVTIKVASVSHPMADDHYISFVAIKHGDTLQKVTLTPDKEPLATFMVPENEKITAYEYCNLHGLWSFSE